MDELLSKFKNMEIEKYPTNPFYRKTYEQKIKIIMDSNYTLKEAINIYNFLELDDY
jgi:hypothetical protein